LKVTLLGTGTSQGVPVISCTCRVCQSADFRDHRLRSSLLIEANDQNIVIDTGPDFRFQMLRERVKHLDAVVFTHEHKDHTAGLDDIRPFNFNAQKDMPIYAHERVLNQLKAEYTYIFADFKYPGVPRVKTFPIENRPFDINGLLFTPIQVLHYKLPVFGFRVHDFVYITDANFISEEELQKVKGAKVLILNALQLTPHISHFTLNEAIDLAQKVGAEKTYFTHISHKLGRHQEIEKELPDGIFLAYDGLKIVC
jgi:phosphoribosyl 1,2-cyclic phosphate phosphodiesterase